MCSLKLLLNLNERLEQVVSSGRKPTIHQIIVGASDGDAITQMALRLREELRKDSNSDIFANWVLSDALTDDVFLLKDIPPSEEVDVILYHSSIGWHEVNAILRKRTEKLAVSYHNISPVSSYERFNPQFTEGLLLGREELQMLRQRALVVVADSQFNAEDLASEGFSDVLVLPAGLEPKRLLKEDLNLSLANDLKNQFPNGFILSVSQVLPHKRVEQLLEVAHILNSTHRLGIGLVIAGAARQHEYRHALALHEQSCHFASVQFMGSISDKDLATLFRCSSVYLGMSDHEGLCVPPVEAMSFGIPVVIKGAGAVPETLRSAAIVLPPDAGPLLAAEAVNAVISDNELRKNLILAGHDRIAELESRNPGKEMAKILLELAK